VVRGGADARRRTAPLARFQACQRPRHGERRVDTVTIVFAALSHYEPRLPGPVTVLERLACPEVRGLPAPTDLPADGRAIVIGAVPGSGRLDMRAHRRLHLRSPLVDDSHYVQIPHAEIPAGMQPVALNGLPVACYDDRMLVLFADVGEIAAYLVPLWLERCACPQSPTDADQDAARMAAARIRPAHSPSEQAELTRRDIQSCQASLARLDSEIAALQDQLAALPEAPDPEALTEQIRALAAAGDWTVFDHAADIVFELADPVVIDPRDGTRRRIDPAPQVSLKSWLAHRGALGARGTPEHDRHPRLLGNGFLDPAVEAAVNEFGQAGDLAGGLELIRDVLTAFQPDDPGLALLDDWPAA
jgi:hypothetical protein